MKRGAITLDAGTLALVALMIAGVGLAATGILIPYSYWFDELYSVTAAAAPWDTAFTVFLHGWINLFGTSEIATRGFSLLCVMASLGILAGRGRAVFGRNTVLMMLALISTSWLFVYYAQEVRSYGLMLFAATAVTVSLGAYIHKGRRRDLAILLAACVLLSWTHYFGLIYAGLGLMAALYWCWPAWSRMVAVCVAGFVCLGWLAIHLTLGEVGDQSGGFWIASNGYQSVFSRASAALTPALNHLAALFFNNSWRLEQASAVLFAALCALVGAFVWRSGHPPAWTTSPGVDDCGACGGVPACCRHG